MTAPVPARAFASGKPATSDKSVPLGWIALGVAVVMAAIYVALRHLPGPDDLLIPSREDLLVGQALLATTGKMGVGHMIAAYPPMALAPMLVIHALTGLDGAVAAEGVAAVLGGGLAGLWFHAIARAGYRLPVAALITALLALNPLFLAAVTQGPEVMLTLCGVWMLANGLYALRQQSGVNDLMLCSAALIVLIFSGSLGALTAIAVLPFLPLAFPADIRPRAYGHLYLVLLFPVVFSFLGFALVNWMMLRDAWAFLAEMPFSGRIPQGNLWQRLAIEIVFVVASTQVLLGQFILVRSRRPVQSVAFALLGLLMTVAALAPLAGGGLSSIGALALSIPATAAAITRWPPQANRSLRIALLLLLGVVGGGSVLFAEIAGLVSSRNEITRQQIAEQQLGTFLIGHDDVLIDAASHPRLVAARGSAEGLVAETDTAFELSLLTRRVETSAVAIAAPDPARSADTLGRIMPDLYASGQPGFHLIYDRNGWRVWAKKRRLLPQGNTPR